MFCSKCKSEYRDGITVCPECGENLADELPKDDKDIPISHDEVPCHVYTAADDFEAEIILAKLKAEGIFAYKQFKGSDSYNRILLGRTILGVDIFVAADQAAEAAEIIKN